jgi:hypothetical protein
MKLQSTKFPCRLGGQTVDTVSLLQNVAGSSSGHSIPSKEHSQFIRGSAMSGPSPQEEGWSTRICLSDGMNRTRPDQLAANSQSSDSAICYRHFDKKLKIPGHKRRRAGYPFNTTCFSMTRRTPRPSLTRRTHSMNELFRLASAGEPLLLMNTAVDKRFSDTGGGLSS